jgi:hypothetical protein
MGNPIEIEVYSWEIICNWKFIDGKIIYKWRFRAGKLIELNGESSSHI